MSVNTLSCKGRDLFMLRIERDRSEPCTQEVKDRKQEENDKENDQPFEFVPVELRKLLQVLDHNLAGQFRLTLSTNTERERHFGDGVWLYM